MKKLLGIWAAVLVLGAVPASAADIKMIANLTGGEETPAAVVSGAVGTAAVTVDPVTLGITVELTVFNLPTGSTAGHIHAGARGAAGPVIVDFTFPAGRTGDFAMVLRLGAVDLRPRPEIGIATMEDAIQAIVNGNAYVNIHTSAFPAGEIRGQLIRVN
ncbi:MAG: CHRD domain-containing protein [Vicinamibacterales bacterium]